MDIVIAEDGVVSFLPKARFDGFDEVPGPQLIYDFSREDQLKANTSHLLGFAREDVVDLIRHYQKRLMYERRATVYAKAVAILFVMMQYLSKAKICLEPEVLSCILGKMEVTITLLPSTSFTPLLCLSEKCIHFAFKSLQTPVQHTLHKSKLPLLYHDADTAPRFLATLKKCLGEVVEKRFEDLLAAWKKREMTKSEFVDKAIALFASCPNIHLYNIEVLFAFNCFLPPELRLVSLLEFTAPNHAKRAKHRKVKESKRAKREKGPQKHQ